MKKKIFVTVVLALTLAALMLPNTAWAGDNFRFRGKSATAFFFSTDGCVETAVFVFASDDRFQSPPGPGDVVSGASIFISRFDFCTGELLMDASGFASLAAPDFQVIGNLNSATLDTTIEVCDFVSGSCFPVSIDLTWTGTGGLSRENSHFHFQSPGFNINSHFNGRFRNAEASGNVSDGATNFTPASTLSAQIQDLKSGTIVVD